MNGQKGGALIPLGLRLFAFSFVLDVLSGFVPSSLLHLVLHTAADVLVAGAVVNLMVYFGWNWGGRDERESQEITAKLEEYRGPDLTSAELGRFREDLDRATAAGTELSFMAQALRTAVTGASLSFNGISLNRFLPDEQLAVLTGEAVVEPGISSLRYIGPRMLPGTPVVTRTGPHQRVLSVRPGHCAVCGVPTDRVVPGSEPQYLCDYDALRIGLR